jgi:hypothetical protein
MSIEEKRFEMGEDFEELLENIRIFRGPDTAPDFAFGEGLVGTPRTR